MANNNNFNLTLDTLAPSGSISASRYYKMNVTAEQTGHLTIDKGDAAYMKVWFDNNDVGTKEDAGYTNAAWETANTVHATNFSEDGNYYYHLVLMDDVGNESDVYSTTIITYDLTAPEVKTATINSSAMKTNKKNNSFYFEFEDPAATDGAAGSGVVLATITGDLVESPMTFSLTTDEIQQGHATRTVTFSDTAKDGVQTITVTVTDGAGNVSEGASDTITLDTTAAQATLILRDSDNSKNLPEYVNKVPFTAVIDITGPDTTSSDVVGYKIWGDIQDKEEEPTDWTEVTAGTDPITITNLSFLPGANASGTDGERTVNCKIIDDANNETTLVSCAIKLDTTAPTASLVESTHYISKIAGYDEVSITPTVTENFSGVATWKLEVSAEDNSGTVNTTTLRQGTGATTIPKDGWKLSYTDLPAENKNNSITLTVTDGAGNSVTSDAVTVWLDTSAPTVSITNLDPWYTKQFDITVAHADTGSGGNTIYAWVDTTSNTSTVPTTTTPISASDSPQTVTASSIDWTSVAQSANNYMHVKVIDTVGNETTAHTKFGYDSVKPADGQVILKSYTNVPNINTTLTSTDTTSGVAFYKIWGDITSAATEDNAEWIKFTASPTTVSVTLTGGDGNKSVNVRFKDTAGNTSENIVSATVELDTAKPSGSLELYTTNDCTTTVSSNTNVSKFYIQLSNMDDTSTITDLDLQYMVYGDFTFTEQSAQGITEGTAQWEKVVLDSGKTVMTITEPAFFTSGDGSKSVYVKFKDNSDNKSEASVQTRTYDTQLPTVTISGIDYGRISKVHTLRRASGTETSGEYNDEMHFTFTPDSIIQAYKVCAYMDQNAAKGGSSEDPEIPNEAGSLNMSGTGISSQAAVACTIKGTDYETALRTTGNNEATTVDGLHIVVVYVQDLSGNWSEAATFAV